MTTTLAIALIGSLQLVVILVLERTPLLGNLTKVVFLQTKERFDGIKPLFGDKKGTTEAENTEEVLRVTEFIFGLFSSGLNLVVGAASAFAIGWIGDHTHQRPPWMMTGAYVASAVCGISLIVLLVMILARKVQDYPDWRHVPKSKMMRFVRRALSLRTPESYKVIVIIATAYLLFVSSQYVDSAPLSQ